MAVMTAAHRQPSPRDADESPRVGVLGRVADLSQRRRRLVVVVWIAAVVATIALSSAFAGAFKADYTARGSDSRTAQDLLGQRFPALAGQGIDLAVHSTGPITDPAVRAAVTDLLSQVRTVPHVTGTTDPYRSPGDIAADGRTARATIRLDVSNPQDMPVADSQRIMALTDQAQRPGLQLAVGGQAVQNAEQGNIGSEGIGLAAAAVILLLVFGSVVAAGLPIVVAVIGLGISGALVGLFAAVIDVPDWSTSLAAMMGIGVGIDYVLLMVTRYREFLGRGLAPRSAIMATADTAGRAVLVAGSTVVISLLGLFAMGLSAMRGAAVVTIAAVLVTMLASATLLPALLGFVGHRIDRLRIPGLRRRDAAGSQAWWRWSRIVQRRPWTVAAAGVAILAVLALPALGVRFGFPDSGNDRAGTSSRQTYDMLSAGFGAGANGPLLLAAELDRPGDTAALADLRGRLERIPGVAAVSPPQLNQAGDTAVLTVVPTTSPQSTATEDLVRTLRDRVVPAATDGTGTRVYVGGATAAAIDSTADTTRRLPLLITGVIALSFLLLLTAFRSLAIPVKAALLNLLSIGAAYGVVAYVLQGGWAGRLIGIDTPTPLPAFIPVLMFAVLFGLSMDYEVFLVSRIRERWVRSQDNGTSVFVGLAATGRVITAAAAIMVAVFAAFVPSPEVILKVVGVGMASAILIDVLVVRMMLVPAVMHILGRVTWWMPAWLERALPRVRVEGRDDHEVLVAPAGPAPDLVLEPVG